jgi:hypothetical protein
VYVIAACNDLCSRSCRSSGQRADGGALSASGYRSDNGPEQRAAPDICAGARAAYRALTAALLWLVRIRGHEANLSADTPLLARFESDNPLLLRAAVDGSPVVAMDALTTLPADLYLPAPVLSRIYYLTAPRLPNYSDVNDHLMVNAARYLPIRIRVDSWHNFAATRQRFLLYTHTAEFQPVWMYSICCGKDGNLSSGRESAMRASSK